MAHGFAILVGKHVRFESQLSPTSTFALLFGFYSLIDTIVDICEMMLFLSLNCEKNENNSKIGQGWSNILPRFKACLNSLF